jgi:predicted dehydrogenase
LHSGKQLRARKFRGAGTGMKGTSKLRVGIIGCGNISMTYLRNAALFGGVELTACADISAEIANLRASEHGIRALSVEALLADPEGAQPDDSRRAFRY